MEGRLVIAREVREKLGLKRGDNLIPEIKDNEIVLYPYAIKATENLKKDDLADFLSK
jgi:AbrB family looped-hinge helix DNA binding protein